VATAILRVADDGAFRERCRANLREVRCEYTWERTLAPLIRFCSEELRPPRRRVGLLAPRAADWFASEAAYRARFIWPQRIRAMAKGPAA
jgi:hypothetical protein